MNRKHVQDLAGRVIRFVQARGVASGAVLFMLIPVAMCFSGCASEQVKIEESKRRGDEIIHALEEFRAEKGHYPRALNELLPKYMPEIPPPTWGLREWQYTVATNEISLRVDESVRTGDGDSLWLRYEGSQLGWQVGD